MSHYSHPAYCHCNFCTRDRIKAAEAKSRIAQFDALMAEIHELRCSRAIAIEHRDRKEFDGFRRLASALSLKQGR